mmetsp:Transcript_46616/g.101308  ORF Transcript_46616/g.101308 Transcript_46616/m.101308 type:complete len:87 (-) Transcript_46616:1936-2196(-)|eukprot:5879588-Pleurochrysis_carterae.AAC.2
MHIYALSAASCDHSQLSATASHSLNPQWYKWKEGMLAAAEVFALYFVRNRVVALPMALETFESAPITAQPSGAPITSQPWNLTSPG